MSLSDFKQSKPKRPDGWVEVDGVWECPECGEPSDECYYNNDKGVVGYICKDHPDADIYIGKGLA